MSAHAGFSRDDQLRLLQQQYGVDAKRAAVLLGAREAVQAPLEAPVVSRAVIPLPLRFTLPWTALVSDDAKYAPAYTSTNRPRLILKRGYRDAKRKARRIAQQVVGNARPLSVPLQLYVRVWLPDNRPGHDTANFAKCCHDAFEKVIYANDQWLYRTIWERAGVDPDRPRADIEIRPYAASLG